MDVDEDQIIPPKPTKGVSIDMQVASTWIVYKWFPERSILVWEWYITPFTMDHNWPHNPSVLHKRYWLKYRHVWKFNTITHIPHKMVRKSTQRTNFPFHYSSSRLISVHQSHNNNFTILTKQNSSKTTNLSQKLYPKQRSAATPPLHQKKTPIL